MTTTTTEERTSPTLQEAIKDAGLEETSKPKMTNAQKARLAVVALLGVGIVGMPVIGWFSAGALIVAFGWTVGWLAQLLIAGGLTVVGWALLRRIAQALFGRFVPKPEAN